MGEARAVARRERTIPEEIVVGFEIRKELFKIKIATVSSRSL
jgi:hypothetical protein